MFNNNQRAVYNVEEAENQLYSGIIVNSISYNMYFGKVYGNQSFTLLLDLLNHSLKFFLCIFCRVRSTVLVGCKKCFTKVTNKVSVTNS